MKLMLAEAFESTREHLAQSMASWGFDVEEFASGYEIWQALQAQISPAIVVLGDLSDGLPSLEVCRRARQRVAYPTTYIITFSKPGQMQGFGEALEAGADDYLIKPFALEELHLRLQNGERLLKLEAELASAKHQLNSRTANDPLTGAWQRNTVLEHLERELLRARREEAFVGLLLVDLDGLKNINQQFGEATGDLVLKETVSYLRTILRPYDALGRIGDDEFLVVLSGCDDARALRVGRRIQSSINQNSIPAFKGKCQITMGIGIASNKLDSTVDCDTLFMVAEQALRTAKTVGTNGLVAGHFAPANDTPEF